MITVKEDRANRQTFLSIDDATKRVRRGLNVALGIIGRENVKYCKELIRKPPKTGNIYTIGRRRHQASAPGEPPATLSGELLRSIKFRVAGWDFMEFGDEAEHGKFLETGTRKMEARPHLTRTVADKSKDNFNELAKQTGLELKKK